MQVHVNRRQAQLSLGVLHCLQGNLGKNTKLCIVFGARSILLGVLSDREGDITSLSVQKHDNSVRIRSKLRSQTPTNPLIVSKIPMSPPPFWC